MAIDLYFYSTNQTERAQSVLEAIRAEHPELFENKFVIYSATDADQLQKEIASDYGFQAKSAFMISLNDKSAAASVLDVAGIVKDAFGEDRVIAMRGGDDGLL